jgi:hypothetical protein
VRRIRNVEHPDPRLQIFRTTQMNRLEKDHIQIGSTIDVAVLCDS